MYLARNGIVMSGINKRKERVRRKLRKVSNCPHRLVVFVSNSHVHAQVISDDSHTTIASASTVEKELRAKVKGANKNSAKIIGELIGKRCLDKGIKKVYYDRSGRKYHGCVKVLADAARESLDF